ncbi:unnamed protein product [Citrullus colocynthis]|uniref:Uncharacterized protein n=1 Tax=Citrullus colocynthis TaxID=252529 RepID=A0ABP0Y1W0_9ROSI
MDEATKAKSELMDVRKELEKARALLRVKEEALKVEQEATSYEQKARVKAEIELRRKIVDAFKRSWLPLTDAHENHFKHLISQGIPPHEAMDQVTACTPPCS